MNYADLVEHCQGLIISVSEEQAEVVETAIRDQASSNLWHSFRAGRITVSNMKSVSHTDPVQFTTVATRWGCDHEKIARDTFIKTMSRVHNNFHVCDAGLFINPDT